MVNWAPYILTLIDSSPSMFDTVLRMLKTSRALLRSPNNSWIPGNLVQVKAGVHEIFSFDIFLLKVVMMFSSLFTPE
jgi:hypothetical protein